MCKLIFLYLFYVYSTFLVPGTCFGRTLYLQLHVKHTFHMFAVLLATCQSHLNPLFLQLQIQLTFTVIVLPDTCLNSPPHPLYFQLQVQIQLQIHCISCYMSQLTWTSIVSQATCSNCSQPLFLLPYVSTHLWIHCISSYMSQLTSKIIVSQTMSKLTFRSLCFQLCTHTDTKIFTSIFPPATCPNSSLNTEHRQLQF